MLTIDIYSDTICPWCYIGKKRLTQALAMPDGDGLVGDDITINWRAYQLYPGLPKEGMEATSFRKMRGQGGGGSSSTRDLIIEEGKAEGIEFDFRAAKIIPNTHRSHQLMVLAHTAGKQDEILEALFQAYFVKGRDVGNLDVLTDIAACAGMDAQQTHKDLQAGIASDAVDAELNDARNLSVNGVPSFVLGGKFPIPGAQSAETLAQFFIRGKQRLSA